MSESIDLRKLILEYLSQDALLSSKEIHEGLKQIAAYATVKRTLQKLISDVLTSAKVPNLEREQQLVLVDEEKIIACPGFCIDRRAVSKTGDQEIIQVKIN